MKNTESNLHALWDEYGVTKLMESVAFAYGISINDFYSSSRLMKLVEAKRCVLWFLVNHSGISISKSAKLLRFHHANVIHHVIKYNNFLEFDKVTIDKHKKINKMMLPCDIDYSLWQHHIID